MSKYAKHNLNPVRDIPKYFGIFRKYLGLRIYIIFALTLVAGLAEGFGILMVLPLLQGLDVGANNGEANAISEYLGLILSWFGLGGSTLAVLFVITVAFVLKGCIVFLAMAVEAALRGELMRGLKSHLFDDYSRMRYQYYASRDSGHFINIINGQIGGMISGFTQLAQLAKQTLNTLVYTVLAFVVAWRFGLMALIFGVVLLFMFRRLNIRVRELSRKNAFEAGVLNKLLIQVLHAFKYLTATNQTMRMRHEVINSIGKQTHYQVRTDMASGFTETVREPLAVVFIMGIVVVQLVVLNQPLAPILVSIVLFNRGFSSILAIQASWQSMLAKSGAIETVHKEFTAQAQQREPDGPKHIGPLSEGITFKNISFAYNEEQAPVINSLSLNIPVRQSVAFVGESGAGKSTLVDMLTLMLKPQQGQVLVDGVPSDQIALSSWRQQIGYVSQETVVFDDSIANNICMWAGEPSSDSALMDRIVQAAKRAHIHHHIESLPEGYHTLVGDRGVRLSGGQRQRLFIARELFREPHLLILDEATSALDTESERHIQASIDALKGQVTVVIIAHRLSTIRNVDHVYVLNKGRLVEDGAYGTLREDDNSHLSRLIQAQSI
jgi:ABC-type bacteriocin/lantibiotic exporter with double-glycine peptidase domain